MSDDADETTCAECGSPYELRDGCEPTKYCDECAHQAIDRLVKAQDDAIHTIYHLRRELEESDLAYKQLIDHINRLFRPLNQTAHSTAELIDTAHTRILKAEQERDEITLIAKDTEKRLKVKYFRHAAALLARLEEPR